MTPNAMTQAEFCLQKDRLRTAYHGAKHRLSSWAFTITEGLLRGECQVWIDGALSEYSKAKVAEEVAFQEYVDFLPPPAASDSPQQQ